MEAAAALLMMMRQAPAASGPPLNITISPANTISIFTTIGADTDILTAALTGGAPAGSGTWLLTGHDKLALTATTGTQVSVRRTSALSAADAGSHELTISYTEPGLPILVAIVQLIIVEPVSVPPPPPSSEYPAPAGPAPQVYTVNDTAQLIAAKNAAKPGNHIVLNAVDFTGSKFVLDKGGTDELPIVYRAATRVRAKLDEVTTVGARMRMPFDIQASNVIIHGLNFDGRMFPNGNFGNRALISSPNTFNLRNVTLKRLFLHGYRGSCVDFNVASGDNVKVMYCFMTVRDFGLDYPGWTRQQLEAELGTRPGDYRRSRRHYQSPFKLTNPLLYKNHIHGMSRGAVAYSWLNHRAVMIGAGSLTEKPPVYARIEKNLFSDSLIDFGAPCTELKAADCIYIGNTFHNGTGHITSRQGRRNKFIANYFADWRTDLRLFDAFHEASWNVIEGGTISICTWRGDVAWNAPPADKNNKYPQSHACVLRGNRRISGDAPLYRIGAAFSITRDHPQSLPSSGTIIEGYLPTHGTISYGLHSGTVGPSPAFDGDAIEAVRLYPKDVGLDADL